MFCTSNHYLMFGTLKSILLFLIVLFSVNIVAQTSEVVERASDNYSVIRNQEKSFGRKFLQGSGLVFRYEGISLAILYASPSSFSNWQKPTARNFKENMKRAFTYPPVIDNDKWYINYVGHPYQGVCTYNALRSQGSTMWQSSLFTIGHSFAWEYLIESGNEQTSF